MPTIPLDPASLEGYVELALRLEANIQALIARLQAAGVTDEQIAAQRADLAARIARSEQA